MTRIEEIEELLEHWKALVVDAKNKRIVDVVGKYETGVIALESALVILKKPSNQKLNHKQAKCLACDYHRKIGKLSNCPVCDNSLTPEG